MKATYEKDISENIGNGRNLILLGVRADADINHLNQKTSELKDTWSQLVGNTTEKDAFGNVTISEMDFDAFHKLISDT